MLFALSKIYNFSYGLLDIRGENNKCFLNCIVASMFSNELKIKLGAKYESEKRKGKNYEIFYDRINCSNINFPVGLNEIKTFEKNNPYMRFHIWTLKNADYYKNL